MPRPSKGSRIPGSGRKKGVPNKVTASMRQAWMDAFDKLGGVPALVRWGEANPDDFYKAVTKLIPQDVTSGGEKMAGVVVLPATNDGH